MLYMIINHINTTFTCTAYLHVCKKSANEVNVSILLQCNWGVFSGKLSSQFSHFWNSVGDLVSQKVGGTFIGCVACGDYWNIMYEKAGGFQSILHHTSSCQ